MRTGIITLAATVVVVVLAFAAFINSGLYYVGADRTDAAMIQRAVHKTMMRSVANYADEVKRPSNLGSPMLINAGAMHYKSMCVSCYLAPGVDSSELRMGLNPKPPKLATVADELSPEEIFWIIKHGVRMSAMPAWGKSHNDEAIWAMTAFVKNKLPMMTAAEFDQVVPVEEGYAAHGHGEHGHNAHAQGAEQMNSHQGAGKP